MGNSCSGYNDTMRFIPDTALLCSSYIESRISYMLVEFSLYQNPPRKCHKSRYRVDWRELRDESRLCGITCGHGGSDTM